MNARKLGTSGLEWRLRACFLVLATHLRLLKISVGLSPNRCIFFSATSTAFDISSTCMSADPIRCDAWTIPRRWGAREPVQTTCQLMLLHSSSISLSSFRFSALPLLRLCHFVYLFWALSSCARAENEPWLDVCSEKLAEKEYIRWSSVTLYPTPSRS